ncbi:hypothetical protein GCM10020000_66950 [Streptomyces olivoverticillatus]
MSSPNTPGLRNLQATEALRPLLTAVREAADRTVTDRRVPLLVKIAPDLADEDVDAVADLAVELGLDGIIATNTTIARDGLGLKTPQAHRRGHRCRRSVRRPPQGALPGGPEPPVRPCGRPDHPGGGVGGIETADDAWERILAGATLVQGYSAFIYEGPFWCRKIHNGLAEKLAASPYATLAEAVGAEHRKVTA